MHNSTVEGFRLKTYNSNAMEGLIDVDRSESGNVSLYGPTIESVDGLRLVPMVLTANREAFAAFGATILYGRLDDVHWGSYGAFSGTVTSLQSGDCVNVNQHIYGNALSLRNIPGIDPATVTPDPVLFIPVIIDGAEFRIPIHGAN